MERRSSSNKLRKQVEMTVKVQAMELIHKLIEGTSRHDLVGHAKALVLKLIEEQADMTLGLQRLSSSN